MRNVGTVVRGIRTPIIKHHDDLAEIVVDSLMKASKNHNFDFNNRDVVSITEAVVAISENNYVSLDDVVIDLQNKFKSRNIGIVYPILSRNRFSLVLKALARAMDSITILLSFPKDEFGNGVLDSNLLMKYNYSPSSTITEEEYNNYFMRFLHPFTGLNMVKYYREVVENEDCKVKFVFSNNPMEILNYSKSILVCDVHSRVDTKKVLETGAEEIFSLDEIMTQSINGSGYNPKYGLLGSNKATEEKLKLFPRDGEKLVLDIQKRLKKLTGKKIEVMVFGDGAFKDPVGGIWELVDPVVSPFYTKGLEGTPNEIKLKYLSDNKYADLEHDELKKALIEEVKNKDKDLKGKNDSLGTTPRRITDLLGSLSDLTCGSGDKGTPVILIQGYFDNIASD